MGFREDQFKITQGVFSGVSDADVQQTNPPFNYTSSKVRVLTNFSNDTGFSRDSPITTLQLKRGFMRNLNTKWGSVGTMATPPQYKLRFQFNPTTIQQNVEARQDMYLSILQDPYQLTQPVAGSTSFSFELLFDRTHEVMNGGKTANIFEPPTGQDPLDNTSGDAVDIGVLADLRVMYAIIGQGFTVDTLTAQYNVVRENARREYERAIASGDPLFSQPEYDSDKKIYKERNVGEVGKLNLEGFNDYFSEVMKATSFMPVSNDQSDTANINVGNSAFLVPMPVRIIFSALYMIDGYVTSTNVIFTKFNTHMVPTQCRVLLNMHAAYIGFARDQTFISYNIEKSGEAAREEYDAAKKELQDFCKEYGKCLTNYKVKLGWNDYKFSNQNSTPLFPELSTIKAYSYATSGTEIQTALALSSPFDNVDERLAINFSKPAITAGFGGLGCVEVGSSGFGPTRGTTVESGLHSYYESGGTVSIERETVVSVYGPYNSKEEAEKLGKNEGYLAGNYTDTRTAGNKDEWISGKSLDKGTAGAYSIYNRENEVNAASRTIGIDEFYPPMKNITDLSPTEAKDALTAFDNAYGDKYFAFYADVKVTIKSGDMVEPQVRTSSSSAPIILKGSDNVNEASWELILQACSIPKTLKPPRQTRDPKEI